MKIPEKNNISLIADHLKPFIHRTPVMRSEQLNKLCGADLYFKCENFQKTGSFKIRGAMNAVMNLTAGEKSNGVITHSSGNFAQALAYATAKSGIKASIIMPENVIPSKRDAVLGYGAEIIYSGTKPNDRETLCYEVQQKTGAYFVHPSNDFNVICGHTSCAVELIEDSEKLDAVFVPVGGGGLASGISIGFRHFSPETKIFGAEPANADDAFRSLKAGKIIPSENPDTIADGLKTSLGSNTFPVLKELLTGIITVTEDEIIRAMKLIWERIKIIIEPSSAVSLAAFLKQKNDFGGANIGLILSGGNVNLLKLPF